MLLTVSTRKLILFVITIKFINDLWVCKINEDLVFLVKKLNMKNKKNMETKKLLVSFLVFVSILLLAANVSATDVGSINSVKINSVNVLDNPAIIAGDTIFVKTEFTSDVNASDITVEVEIKGDRKDVRIETSLFDVEEGNSYTRTLKLDIPFDLKDELSGFVDLNIEIGGSGYKTTDHYVLRVQRESYNLNTLSVSVPQTVNTGESFPVDFVLKNIGYNNLDDLFVTVKISALNIEKSVFFGDLVALECDDDSDSIENYGVDIDRRCFEDKTDTASGRIFLQLPFDVNPGIYALELETENEDFASSKTVQLVVENAFPNGHFIVSEDQLVIVNPTNQLVVYRLVPQSTGVISVSLSDNLVAVPAGSSKTITVDATSRVMGTHTYDVNVFAADGSLVDTINFTKTFEGRVTSPIVILTIILVIIFIVLLVALIVLIGKKPKKTEEFGESYY